VELDENCFMNEKHVKLNNVNFLALCSFKKMQDEEGENVYFKSFQSYKELLP
jgi:hypothetical protein